jgi:zinc/manganese transport system substrate-binding protein
MKGFIMFIIKKYLPWLAFFGLGLLLLNGCGSPAIASSGSSTIKVVAAENFYGDIARQLGGSHVTVTSILSDPNVDPHEYESSYQNATAVSDAQLVIENSDGYDSWMDKLLSSSPNPNRRVIKAFDVAPHKLPVNEHVWYSMTNILAIAQNITTTLKQLDTKDTSAFAKNLATFSQSIQGIDQKIAVIKAKYAGTPVGLTETIFLYQTELLGLKMLTPFAFQKAIAEANDPPADTVVTVNNQVSQKEIKVLIYNEQTITAITTNVENAAMQQHIPIVPVTETMPPGKTYQSWMLSQLNTLQQALGG